MTVRETQRALNAFTTTFLKDVAPLRVDGKVGAGTRRRIRWVKFYLGYAGTAGQQNASVDAAFRARMRRPRSLRHSTPARIRRGVQRRVKQRRDAARNSQAATRASGVGKFDGRPVANWLVPYLTWARANGWRGTLTSGWRDPAYSERLCYRMCGRPSCPGRCAGRASNHSGSVKPSGSLDVSDYYRFGQLMRRCPHGPRLFNALPNDRVHFSASGR